MENKDRDGTSVFQPQLLGIRGLKEFVMLEELHVMCCSWIMGVYGRALGEVLDIGREYLDIVLQGMVSQRPTFHLTCQYFPTPLP